MKKIITIFLFISSITIKANTDSNKFDIDALDVLTIHHMVGGSQPTSVNYSQITANMFQKFWNWVTTPFRPEWGRYEESNHRQEGPLHGVSAPPRRHPYPGGRHTKKNIAHTCKYQSFLTPL